MAYNKNAQYRYSWTSGNGWQYKLILTPADDEDITSGTIIDLPQGSVLIDTVKQNCAYNDDLPIGLPLTNELTFELNYVAFVDDFIDVLSWIDGGTRQLTRGGVVLSNVWHLQTDRGSGGVTWYNEFIGYQEYNIDREITVEPTTCNREIKCFGIERTLEQINMGALMYECDLLVDAHGVRKTLCFDTRYDATSPGVTKEAAFLYNQSVDKDNKGSMAFLPLYYLPDIFANAHTKVMQHHLRDSSALGILPNIISIEDTFQFYEQNMTDQYNTKGSQIISAYEFLDLVYIMVSAKGSYDSDGEPIEMGLFNSNSQSGYIKEFRNAYDIVKSIYENFLVKGHIDYGAVGDSVILYADQILSKTNIATFDITDNPCGMDSGVKYNYGNPIVGGAILYNKGMNTVKRDKNARNPLDSEQIEVSNYYYIEDAPMYENHLVIHNSPISAQSKQFSKTLKQLVFALGQPPAHSLFYYPYIDVYNSNQIMRVSDYTVVNIGGTDNYTSTSDYNSVKIFESNKVDAATTNYYKGIDAKHTCSGMSYCIANAMKSLLGSEGTGFSEISGLDISFFTHQFIGNVYDINVKKIVPQAIADVIIRLGTKAILTNMTINYNTGKVDCKFFHHTLAAP